MAKVIELGDIGLDQETLQRRVIDAICNSVMRQEGVDGDWEDTPLAEKLSRTVKQAVDAKVREIGDERIAPIVKDMIENHCLQKTNGWGEKIGQPVTFTEYLVAQAERYFSEPVTHNGKRPDHYTNGSQTRIAYMIDQHLQYSISTAIKRALDDMNSQLAKGLSETVKIQLAAALERLKVTAQVVR